MIRTLAMAGGVAGALGLSQFPEFSQQYLQRLSGAVDELRVMAVAFDGSATLAGLSRDEALAEIGGSEFEEGLRGTLQERLGRYDRLASAEAELKDRTPLMRLAAPWHFSDTELVQATYQDYRPAVPVTTDGLICAGIGYVGGWAVISGLFALILLPFRRRRTA